MKCFLVAATIATLYCSGCAVTRPHPADAFAGITTREGFIERMWDIQGISRVGTTPEYRACAARGALTHIPDAELQAEAAVSAERPCDDGHCRKAGARLSYC